MSEHEPDYKYTTNATDSGGVIDRLDSLEISRDHPIDDHIHSDTSGTQAQPPSGLNSLNMPDRPDTRLARAPSALRRYSDDSGFLTEGSDFDQIDDNF